jgi:hypothetical protein
VSFCTVANPTIIYYFLCNLTVYTPRKSTFGVSNPTGGFPSWHLNDDATLRCKIVVCLKTTDDFNTGIRFKQGSLVSTLLRSQRTDCPCMCHEREIAFMVVCGISEFLESVYDKTGSAQLFAVNAVYKRCVDASWCFASGGLNSCLFAIIPIVWLYLQYFARYLRSSSQNGRIPFYIIGATDAVHGVCAFFVAVMTHGSRASGNSSSGLMES